MPSSSPRIAFYITGHGFGHASRMRPVLERLARQGVTLFIRSGAPDKFFTDLPGARHHREHYDVGAVQHDGLNVDVAETLVRYAAIHNQREAIIAREAAFLRAEGVDMVVADITPLAFDIAEAVGVPSVAVSHFTWDWIYEPYAAQYPDYGYLVEAMRRSYARASLALQMPFAHDFSVFRCVEPVPLVLRDRGLTDDAIRAQFALPDGARLVVLSMGGMDWGAAPLNRLRAMRDCVFVLPPDMAALKTAAPNFRVVPDGYTHFHDLTAVADLVIAKAGGVTVSECIAYHTPLICTFRDDFREDELLRPALARHAHALEFDKAAFERGDWLDAIAPFMAADGQWSDLPLNGADVVAGRIMALLGV